MICATNLRSRYNYFWWQLWYVLPILVPRNKYFWWQLWYVLPILDLWYGATNLRSSNCVAGEGVVGHPLLAEEHKQLKMEIDVIAFEETYVYLIHVPMIHPGMFLQSFKVHGHILLNHFHNLHASIGGCSGCYFNTENCLKNLWTDSYR